jgi:hypothetical protein
MNYNWFKIFNRTEFDALELTSKTYTLFLEGVGEKDILVTKGNYYGMTYEGIFLCLQMGDVNPYVMDGHAAYLDEATDDVYLGLPT